VNDLNEIKKESVEKQIEQQIEQTKKSHQIGWGLFIFCSLFFLMAGIRAKDLYTVIGSLLFFIACFFFLVPMFRKK